jgi:hypothetical protein
MNDFNTIDDNVFLRLAKPCTCGTRPEIDHWGHWYSLFCRKCKREGPADLGLSGAVVAWNERMEKEKTDDRLQPSSQ